ncbi:MAG: polysaccharide biosynthesis C-terminal domain-containing protein [Ruthenibacterium lactatiformans]
MWPSTLGEGDSIQGQRYFSMLVYVTIGGGMVFPGAGAAVPAPHRPCFWAHRVPCWRTASFTGGILLAGQTMLMLQNVFQSLLITAGEPHFGLGVTVAAGLTNIILDFLCIAVFRWGVAGAPFATAASQFLGGGVGGLYLPARTAVPFARSGKTKLDSRALLKACTNGFSRS